jgi:hypothetical protein
MQQNGQLTRYGYHRPFLGVFPSLRGELPQRRKSMTQSMLIRT